MTTFIDMRGEIPTTMRSVALLLQEAVRTASPAADELGAAEREPSTDHPLFEGVAAAAWLTFLADKAEQRPLPQSEAVSGVQRAASAARLVPGGEDAAEACAGLLASLGSAETSAPDLWSVTQCGGEIRAVYCKVERGWGRAWLPECGWRRPWLPEASGQWEGSVRGARAAVIALAVKMGWDFCEVLEPGQASRTALESSIVSARAITAQAAKEAVRRIAEDLSTRRGLGDEWFGISEADRAALMVAWSDAIVAASQAGGFTAGEMVAAERERCAARVERYGMSLAETARASGDAGVGRVFAMCAASVMNAATWVRKSGAPRRGEAESAADRPMPVRFTYVNYRGARAERLATPIRIWRGSTEYHPEPCWLMDAFDHDMGMLHTFAMHKMSDLRDASLPSDAAAGEAAGPTEVPRG